MTATATRTLVTSTRTNRSWDNGDFVALPDMGMECYEDNEAMYWFATDIARGISKLPQAGPTFARAYFNARVQRHIDGLNMLGANGLNGRQLCALAYFAGVATDAEAATHNELQFTPLA